MTERPSTTKGRRPRSRMRRRVTGALALGTGPRRPSAWRTRPWPRPRPRRAQTAAAANAPANESVDVRKGRQLYETTCITCHGANLQGVQDRGPVADRRRRRPRSTSRSPPGGCRWPGRRPRPAAQEAEVHDETQIAAARGVRPVASAAGRTIPTGDLRGDDANLAEGGELFRLNCASCHNFTGQGGALSAGQVRAAARRRHRHGRSTTAMLTGPQNMPVFSDNQLTTDGEAGDHHLRPDPRSDRRTRAAAAIGRHRPGVRGPGRLGGRDRRDHVDDPVDRSQVMSDASGRRRPAEHDPPDGSTSRPDRQLQLEAQAAPATELDGVDDRAPPGALPDPGHQGGEARRARGRRLCSCSPRSAAVAFIVALRAAVAVRVPTSGTASTRPRSTRRCSA